MPPDADELPEVLDPLLTPEHRELIARFGAVMAPRTAKVHVRPMARYGFSTAKLVVVHFDEHRAGRPFVVKMDRHDKFEEENNALKELLVFFEDADVHTHKHGEYGAIAYPLRENPVGDIETFEDALTADNPDDGRLVEALTYVYKRCCGRVHAAGTVETRSLADEYAWYHNSIGTDAALAKALGVDFDDAPFDYIGVEIVDPRAVKAMLDKTRCDITVGPVHGDLHGSNIVFDADGQPHLIDFAWGNRSGQILKDFVLMENSLRFFAFPRYFDIRLQAEVETALVEPDGAERVLGLTAGTPLEAEYARLSRLVALTREHANEALGNNFFEEYLQAQFMMLYRLLQYRTYPFHPTLRALGAIGRRVVHGR